MLKSYSNSLLPLINELKKYIADKQHLIYKDMGLKTFQKSYLQKKSRLHDFSAYLYPKKSNLKSFSNLFIHMKSTLKTVATYSTKNNNRLKCLSKCFSHELKLESRLRNQYLIITCHHKKLLQMNAK